MSLGELWIVSPEPRWGPVIDFCRLSNEFW
jgi:hypothetical protein